MASSFAQGMESGARLAKSWLDTYNQAEEKTRKRRAAEEIAAAGSTAMADLPEQPRTYTAGAPAPAGLGTGAFGTEDDFTSMQPQGLARPAAPQLPPGTGAARGYTPDQVQAVRSAYAAGGAPSAQRAAVEQGVPTQGLTRQLPMSQQLARQADIYARNGLTDQAEQYRLKAYDVGRQEEADSRVRDEYQQKQNTNTAAQWMAEQISSGRTVDMTLIAEAQTKYKGDYNTLLSTTANVLGINDKVAKQKTDRLVAQINEAVLGGEESFNKLLGSFADPNKEDNIVPKLMQVRGGVQVMYGDKPMSPLFTGADGITPLQQAGAFYTNTAQSKPFETAIQMQNLAKGKAAIAKDEAAAGLSRAQTAQVGQDKLSPVEKNLATLQRLGISVTPEDVRVMAGIKPDKLSPEAAAQIELITASVKGNESSQALAKAQQAVTDVFKGEGLKQRNTTIVRGLRAANEKNDLPAALTQLQEAGVGVETIVGLAKQAGVQLPADFAPSTTPAQAQPTRTGLGGAGAGAAAPYVPPAGSPAAVAAANRARSLEAQSETQRLAVAAQQRLADQFAADARALSPAQLSQKYDALRGQLPVADRARLQQIERNIR